MTREIFEIAALAVFSVIVIVMVRRVNPEIATVLTVAASVVCVFAVMDKLFDVAYSFYDLSEKAGVDKQSLDAVVKIVGIGYVGEFCNGICVDAGCKSVGDKVLFASKIAIVAVSLPIINDMMALLLGLIT